MRQLELCKLRVNAMNCCDSVKWVQFVACNVSELFSRYHGCIVSTKDLNLSPWHQNTIFCISGLMNARLSVLCTLKRAKRRNSGPVRLQARLSVQHFDSMSENTFLWPVVPSGTAFTNLYHFITSVPKTFNIKSITCIPMVRFFYELHEQHLPIQ